MSSRQEYTKLGDLHPRVQERIKRLDPAEYSNMANPHNSSRYMYLFFWETVYCWVTSCAIFDIARRMGSKDSRHTRTWAYARAILVASVQLINMGYWPSAYWRDKNWWWCWWLTKREVKMAGYWPSSFFVCLWTETKSRSINTQKKERGQYPAISTE